MKNIFLKCLNNSLGFTLVEIMVGGSILAGVALAGATLFQNQSKAQARIQNDQLLSSYHSALAKHLQNDHNCNATFKAKYGAASVGATDDLVSVDRCNTAGATCNSNFNAQTVQLAVNGFAREGEWIDRDGSRQIWMFTNISYANSISETGALTLNVEYTMNPRIETRTVMKQVVVNLRFNQDASNGQQTGFIECFNDQESSVNNLQNDVCKSLYPALTSVTSDGGLVYWDESSQTCKLNGTTTAPLKDCTPQGLMVEGIRSDGTAHCRSVSQGFSPAPLVDSSSCSASSKVKLVWDGTRLKVICVL